MPKKKPFFDEKTLIELSELFKVFGDSTRVKILFLLFKKGGCSGKVISEELSVSQSATSHQLRILKNARLVKNVREGQSLIYSLADSHVVSILNQGMEHVREINSRKI